MEIQNINGAASFPERLQTNNVPKPEPDPMLSEQRHQSVGSENGQLDVYA